MHWHRIFTAFGTSPAVSSFQLESTGRKPSIKWLVLLSSDASFSCKHCGCRPVVASFHRAYLLSLPIRLPRIVAMRRYALPSFHQQPEHRFSRIRESLIATFDPLVRSRSALAYFDQMVKLCCGRLKCLDTFLHTRVQA